MLASATPQQTWTITQAQNQILQHCKTYIYSFIQLHNLKLVGRVLFVVTFIILLAKATTETSDAN